MLKLMRYILINFFVILFCSQFNFLAQTNANDETRYLAFQVFIGTPLPSIPLGASGAGALLSPSNKTSLSRFAQHLVDQIGTTGDEHTKLAFILGPLVFDHTDSQLQRVIQGAFEIDGELVQVVQEFITLWAVGMAQSGVPTDRIYSHTALWLGNW